MTYFPPPFKRLTPPRLHWHAAAGRRLLRARHDALRRLQLLPGERGAELCFCKCRCYVYKWPSERQKAQPALWQAQRSIQLRRC